ncbi:unannotated protein [freshwater metagenome]|uniref:Unannotated protein n=1 Tax=freshwater metagenome TaxID=449393 RepID=A0A6J6XAA6_9ZZZZ
MIRPWRTINIENAACVISSCIAMKSAVISSESAASVDSCAFVSACSWSRSLAAFSNCSAAAASSISLVSFSVTLSGFESKNLIRFLAISRCSSGVTHPTHGAAHFPISPSKHCRFDFWARRKLLSVQERTGNSFNRTS